jgi:hypothetical protein
MRLILSALGLALLAQVAPAGATSPPEAQAQSPTLNILLYDHSAINANAVARARLRQTLSALAEDKAFAVTATRTAKAFSDEGLRDIDVVILAGGDGDVLPLAAGQALDRYLKAGGGLVAIHSAAIRPGAGAALTGLFSRPYQRTLAVSKAEVHADPEGARSAYASILEDLPPAAMLRDRWLVFGEPARTEGGTVLLRSGSLKHRGQSVPGQPVVWARNVGNGRAVYSALGKEDVYSQANGFGRTLLWNTIRWAGGGGAGLGKSASVTTVAAAASIAVKTLPGGVALSLPSQGVYRLSVHDASGKRIHARDRTGRRHAVDPHRRPRGHVPQARSRSLTSAAFRNAISGTPFARIRGGRSS